MNLEIYIIGGTALVIIILFAWVIWLQNKLGKLLVGKSRNLDESLSLLVKEIATLKRFRTEAEENFNNHDARLKKTISGVETIRFNPFKDTGGDQSFILAILITCSIAIFPTERAL